MQQIKAFLKVLVNDESVKWTNATDDQLRSTLISTDAANMQQTLNDTLRQNDSTTD